MDTGGELSWKPGDEADFRLCWDTQPTRVKVIDPHLADGCIRVKAAGKNPGLRRHYDVYPKHLWEVR